jgi:hypothetical protein
MEDPLQIAIIGSQSSNSENILVAIGLKAGISLALYVIQANFLRYANFWHTSVVGCLLPLHIQEPISNRKYGYFAMVDLDVNGLSAFSNLLQMPHGYG